MQRGQHVDATVYDYIVERFGARERQRLEAMKKAAQAAGLPPIQIAEDQAALIRVLCRAIQARRALDVGTLFGFSAATLAEAMGSEGRVVTIEADPRHATVARANFQRLGLEDRIALVESTALEAMQRMEPDSFDVVLIDADKPNYGNYLREGVRLLRPGGLFLADNALAFGKITQRLGAKDGDAQDVRALRAFNETASEHPELDATLATVGDGLIIAVVKKQPATTRGEAKPPVKKARRVQRRS